MLAARFLAETSLELLARRLRILGHDVEVVQGARIETLFEEARRLQRTALTTSSRHPRRYADVAVTVVPRDPIEAVRAIDSRYAPLGAPYSRCASCNTELETRPASAAKGQAPDEIVRRAQRLAHCTGCGRWYWHGSHVDRLRAWFERALGRALAPPPYGNQEFESR